MSRINYLQPVCFKLIQLASRYVDMSRVANDVMDTNEIEKWARTFVADLTMGGEAVPLDRVIARHLPTIASLRAAGLTWRAIAALLARAGGRRKDGKRISADQMRANVSRQLRRRSVPSVRRGDEGTSIPRMSGKP